MAKAERSLDDLVQDALNRLYRASRRGTGCRLSAAEIHALNATAIGQIWADVDPRKEAE